jgi:hypothetical protein
MDGATDAVGIGDVLRDAKIHFAFAAGGRRRLGRRLAAPNAAAEPTGEIESMSDGSVLVGPDAPPVARPLGLQRTALAQARSAGTTSTSERTDLMAPG